MHVPAFEVGLPEHNGKSADTDEHNDCLKKYRWASFHSDRPQPNDPVAMLVRCRNLGHLVVEPIVFMPTKVGLIGTGQGSKMSALGREWTRS